MFYQITGKLILSEQGYCVLDCHGVGYRLTVSTTTQGSIISALGTDEDVRLYTHLAVREDDLELFGFAQTEEMQMFKLLISVSGVGPKAAMAILSLMPPANLAATIAAEDTRALSKAPGIGGKTAARIVLELKDKLMNQSMAIPTVSGAAPAAAPSGSRMSEALDALLVLGYSRAEATAALNQVGGDKTLEEMIKSALARLMKF